MKLSVIDWITLVLVIVGGLNWGLVAISEQWNLVSMIFGAGSMLSQVVYGLVGLSALYLLATSRKLARR